MRNSPFRTAIASLEVGADYKFTLVSAMHAGGTHDSTVIQSTALREVTVGENSKLPNCAVIVAENAYESRDKVLFPLSGRRL
eukprot:IDg14111t1